MSNDPGIDGAPVDAAPQIDTSVPQSARVYDFLLGGKDNVPPDRGVGAALIAQIPTLPDMVRAQRAFLARAVRYLVADAGIRQFLDIGTGIPTANNVHEVAQAIAPEAGVLYVDIDPIVLAHARALMKGTPEGRTAFIIGDLTKPQEILADPTLAQTLDRDRPIALMLVGILHHLRDGDDPYGVVATLVDWLPTGSYLAIAAPASDFDAAAMARTAATAEGFGIPYVPRNRAEMTRFFTGLDLVDPGVVPILGWRPDATTPADVNSVYGWAGVGRKG